ncbi:hypothetical protein AB6A40_004371, partial [Gnathostoma spinigerum]
SVSLLAPPEIEGDISTTPSNHDDDSTQNCQQNTPSLDPPAYNTRARRRVAKANTITAVITKLLLAVFGCQSHQPRLCNTPTNTTVWDTEVALLGRRHVAFRAAQCQNLTRTVCTESYLRLSMAVTFDETIIRSVATTLCQQINGTKQWKNSKLVEIEEGHWKTKNTTHYAIGWWGEKCYTTSNLFVKEGTISVTDRDELLTDLSSTENCRVNDGKCVTKEKTIIWNATTIQRTCSYRNVGIFRAFVTERNVVLGDLQATFIFAETSERDQTNFAICQENGTRMERMENEYVLKFFTETGN